MNKVITAALMSPFILSTYGVGLTSASPKIQDKPGTAEEQATRTTLPANATQSASNNSAMKVGAGAPASDPNVDAQRHYDSAMALAEAGRFDEAVAAFKESLKIRPDDAQTNYALGMTYIKSKSYKEAVESFKKAVRNKPTWDEAHFRLGTTSYVLGKRAQSVDEYKKLLELNSPLANSLYRIINESNNAADFADRSSKPRQTPANSSIPSQPLAAVPDATVKTSSAEPALSDIYRVGVGDVLDVRFLNSASSRSTLFTVVNGGLIDLPVAGGPIAVGGHTISEIQSIIAAELKRRAVEETAQVAVGIRQYSSHSVVVTGLVSSPGTRFLRREAVPLYVVLAESQLRNDAGRVAIMRGGTQGPSLDLSDPATLNVTVQSGDIVTVSGKPQEFYYIAGRINYPGQKNFQPGITLLQAILAAGGTPRQNENIVEISREGTDGRLVTTRFSIKGIKGGTVEDPKLRAGDRIEVIR